MWALLVHEITHSSCGALERAPDENQEILIQGSDTHYFENGNGPEHENSKVSSFLNFDGRSAVDVSKNGEE